MPAIDAVEMIEPPPTLRIGATACLMPRKTLRRRIAIVLSQFSTLMFSSGPTAAKPGVVIDDIEAAELLDRAIDGGLHNGLAGDVGLLEDGVVAVLAAPARRRFCRHPC